MKRPECGRQRCWVWDVTLRLVLDVVFVDTESLSSLLTVPTVIHIISKPTWRLTAQTVRYVAAATIDGVTAAAWP